MTDSGFNTLLEGIYSIFGRQRPAYNSLPYASLRKRIEDKYVPDEAVKFIIARFEDYDTLPVNAGKAIIREFGEWLRENPQNRLYITTSCANCSDFNAGWFYATDGKNTYACKCTCNDNPAFSHIHAMSEQNLAENGWVRVSGRFHSSDASTVHAEKQIKLWRDGKAYEKPAMQGVIGKNFEPRKCHVEQCYEY